MSIAVRDSQLAIYFEGTDTPQLLLFGDQPQGGWVVGRGTGAHIRLSDRSVSRVHAVIKASAISDEAFWQMQPLSQNPTIWSKHGRSQHLPPQVWWAIREGVYTFGLVSVSISFRIDDTLEIAVEPTRELSSLEQAIAEATPSQIEGWPDFAAVALAVVVALLRIVWRGPVEKPSAVFRVIWVGFLVAIGAVVVAAVVPILLATGAQR